MDCLEARLNAGNPHFSAELLDAPRTKFGRYRETERHRTVRAVEHDKRVEACRLAHGHPCSGSTPCSCKYFMSCKSCSASSVMRCITRSSPVSA